MHDGAGEGGPILDAPTTNAHTGTRTAHALALLSRPLLVRQLADHLRCDLDTCMALVRRLRARGRIRCLNPDARRGRVYVRADVPVAGVDWALYGWVCFAHRRAVLEALDEPRAPAELKRRARFLHPDIRLSANNVRDLIRLFRARGIVVPVVVRGRAYPRYALTAQGRVLQRLVWEREARHP